MAIMKCEKLTKAYGKKTVLKELDLTLESGKIYGLIGRNGAGKTTLLSIMSNQNPATSGVVTLDGENIWENRKALDRICFSRELIPGNRNGLMGCTVRRYLTVAAAYLPNWDMDTANKLVKQYKVDVWEKLNNLSKGMLSAVTIIVAMASKAEFTFLDEPVAGLDIVAREEFYQMLLEEHTQTGRTFVVSTHILEEAANVIEDVIILRDGEILLKENALELLDRACYVTGMADQVDAAVAGLQSYRPERLGRNKGVTVLLREGETIDRQYDVTVQPISLQRVFVALCGEEG